MGVKLRFDSWWRWDRWERSYNLALIEPAEKMLAGKKRLIARLKRDIANVRADAESEVQRIESRIRIAQSLADALEKGTLKP